jgi:hypothetical protein
MRVQCLQGLKAVSAFTARHNGLMKQDTSEITARRQLLMDQGALEQRMGNRTLRFRDDEPVKYELGGVDLCLRVRATCRICLRGVAQRQARELWRIGSFLSNALQALRRHMVMQLDITQRGRRGQSGENSPERIRVQRRRAAKAISAERQGLRRLTTFSNI